MRLYIDISCYFLYIVDAMAKLTKSLKDKFEKLSKELSKYPSFSVPDAIGVLKAKETTVRWVLWNLADQGKITRIGKGLYTFRPKFNQETQHHLSELARKVRKVLQESGFHFFISGIDILVRYMVHVPEKYPVLVFVDRDAIEEADDLLKSQQINSIIGDKVPEYSKIYRLISLEEMVILRPTKEFSYAKDEVAEKEKAFVDLYYEVTRASFPLSAGELARIFLNMRRRNFIDEKRLSKIASRRNLHHDLRYILEYKRISVHAHEFVGILKELEGK